MAFTIKTDNTAEVLIEKDVAVTKAMAAIALKMEENAKKEITRKVYDQPESKSGYKRTGRLRNSITSESDGNSGALATEALDVLQLIHIGQKNNNNKKKNKNNKKTTKKKDKI